MWKNVNFRLLQWSYFYDKNVYIREEIGISSRITKESTVAEGMKIPGSSSTESYKIFLVSFEFYISNDEICTYI